MATNSATTPIALSPVFAPVFHPAIAPVVGPDGKTNLTITGTDGDSSQVANLDVYANGQVVGSTGQLSGISWAVDVALDPGVYLFTANAYEFTGQLASTNSLEFITGIQGKPYVTQELNINAQGVVTGVTNFDADGNTIFNNGASGGASTAAHPQVAFDSKSKPETATSALLSGTTTSPGNVASITIYDGDLKQTIDPTSGQVLLSAKPLGTATLPSDGSWSFDAHVSPGVHKFTAVETSFDGSTTTAQTAYQLVTGIVGESYSLQEVDLGVGGKILSTTNFDATGVAVGQSAFGGTNIQNATGPGQVLHSAANDVMTGKGGGTTFSFTPGFGQDEITNFSYGSGSVSASGASTQQAHDIISVPVSQLQSLNQVYHHITTGLDGSAVLHLNPNDSIQIDGVTKAELIAHPSDFRFHP